MTEAYYFIMVRSLLKHFFHKKMLPPCEVFGLMHDAKITSLSVNSIELVLLT